MLSCQEPVLGSKTTWHACYVVCMLHSTTFKRIFPGTTAMFFLAYQCINGIKALNLNIHLEGRTAKT